MPCSKCRLGHKLTGTICKRQKSSALLRELQLEKDEMVRRFEQEQQLRQRTEQELDRALAQLQQMKGGPASEQDMSKQLARMEEQYMQLEQKAQAALAQKNSVENLQRELHTLQQVSKRQDCPVETE